MINHEQSLEITELGEQSLQLVVIINTHSLVLVFCTNIEYWLIWPFVVNGVAQDIDRGLIRNELVTVRLDTEPLTE